MEDTVIPTIVHSKWHNPDVFVVSANIMNQPSLSWVHWHLGGVLPYLPELEPPPPPPQVPEEIRVDWRASLLPDWTGPDDFNMTLDYESAYKKHRWLPVRRETSNRTIDDTPIKHTGYGPFSDGLMKWPVAAQEHYSFFENLENNELWRYKFHTWDYDYMRMGIQFIAMMGDDINAAKPLHERDDEYFFSEVMTKKTKRRECGRLSLTSQLTLRQMELSMVAVSWPTTVLNPRSVVLRQPTSSTVTAHLPLKTSVHINLEYFHCRRRKVSITDMYIYTALRAGPEFRLASDRAVFLAHILYPRATVTSIPHAPTSAFNPFLRFPVTHMPILAYPSPCAASFPETCFVASRTQFDCLALRRNRPCSSSSNAFQNVQHFSEPLPVYPNCAPCRSPAYEPALSVSRGWRHGAVASAWGRRRCLAFLGGVQAAMVMAAGLHAVGVDAGGGRGDDAGTGFVALGRELVWGEVRGGRGRVPFCSRRIRCKKRGCGQGSSRGW